MAMQELIWEKLAIRRTDLTNILLYVDKIYNSSHNLSKSLQYLYYTVYIHL